MKKVLLTGASGRIEAAFFDAYIDQYEFFLTDVREPNYLVPEGHQFVKADLSDLKTIDRLFQGQDTVVHLADLPDPDAEFEQILPANILATTYLIEASHKAKVNRFVFASSAQTIEGYPVDLQISSGMEVAPANLYGVSKCYGEALCSRYASQYGMSCISLRIGAFEPADGPPLATKRDLRAWISYCDATHLIDRAIQADVEKNFIVHGISNNRFKRLDLTETCRVLGYKPQDDAFSIFPIPSD